MAVEGYKQVEQWYGFEGRTIDLGLVDEKGRTVGMAVGVMPSDVHVGYVCVEGQYEPLSGPRIREWLACSYALRDGQRFGASSSHDRFPTRAEAVTAAAAKTARAAKRYVRKYGRGR